VADDTVESGCAENREGNLDSKIYDGNNGHALPGPTNHGRTGYGMVFEIIKRCK
jgi:hypothetical protein